VSDFGLSVFLPKKGHASKTFVGNLYDDDAVSGSPRRSSTFSAQLHDDSFEPVLVDPSMKMLPVRWCAPEVVAKQQFSHASDAWSFGVVLWEILANGQTPWKGLGNQDVVRSIFAGKTLDPYAALKIEEAANSFGSNASKGLERIASTVRRCWAFCPEERPTFTSMLPTLQRQQESIFQLHKTNSICSKPFTLDPVYEYQDMLTHPELEVDLAAPMPGVVAFPQTKPSSRSTFSDTSAMESTIAELEGESSSSLFRLSGTRSSGELDRIRSVTHL
jgi:serine/threonine protein kinase